MSKKPTNIKSELPQFNNLIIFEIENSIVNIDVFFRDETLWLTQKRIAELIEKERFTITQNFKKVFEDTELDKYSVCRDFRHIAFGYRVNSQRSIEYKNINN